MGRHLVGRSVVAGAIGVLSVAVGSLGVATAANGGSLTLGHHNSATRTTTLADSRGTPLSLRAKHGRPPLRVNSSTKVKHLNADELDGSSASDLATAGSGASSHFPDGSRGIVKTTPTLVARTGALNKGTYFVSASASGFVSDATILQCFVTASAPTTKDEDNSAMAEGNFVGVPETVVMSVTRGQRISQFCFVTSSTPTPQAQLSQAGIIATRIAHAGKGTIMKSEPVA
jgi:hypothetical protein